MIDRKSFINKISLFKYKLMYEQRKTLTAKRNPQIILILHNLLLKSTINYSDH